MYRHSLSKSSSLKKNALKKIFIVFLSFVLAFTAYIQSVEKAQAIGFGAAIPGGIQVGAGVYVAGALITAGAAGLIGYDENQEAINAHAQRVWGGATQLSKDSIDYMIKGAVGAGNGLISFSGDYATYLDKNINTIADFIAGMTLPTDYKAGQFQIGSIYNGATYQINSDSGMGIMATVDGPGGTAVASLGSSARIEVSGNTINSCGGSRGCAGFTMTGDPQTVIKALQGATTLQAIVAIWNAHSTGWGMKLIVNDPSYTEAHTQAVSQTKEAWESMRDAGLVLPVDSVTSHVGDIPVRYNPDADTWTSDAGAVYAPGDVTHAFPNVRYREKSDAIPAPGIYTDTPALTGNPAIDKTILENPAIPKTTTNINTGTTVANPDVPITGQPPGTTTPKPEPVTPTPPRVPGSMAPVPVLIFMAFFDLLRALLMYLVRMFNWIMTIPFISERPIDNPYFQWFRQAKILGVYPYTLVTTMATFFLGFSLVKSVRRFLP